MALSQMVKRECSTCGKLAIEASRMTFGKSVLIKLACGHLQTYERAVLNDDIYDTIVFSDGKKPRPYQIDAMKFAAENNFNVLIADEQGLGKTIEVLSLFRLYPEKILPAIFVCPTSTKMQVLYEIERICIAGDEAKRKTFLTQVIKSTKEKAIPGFGIYIVTYDMLKKEDMFEWVPEIKTLVIDECQRIKNHLSDRAKACQKFAKITDYHLPMSGTPIKNHAGEYYTVLNIIAPEKFYNYDKFIREDCDSYEDGWGYKVGGLRDAEDFHRKTSNLIIRRTKAEVLKDLPAKDRKFFHVELDPKLNKAYGALLRELEELLYDDDMDKFAAGSAKIAIMGKLRHITGLSKVETAMEFVTDFIMSCERKITVFCHHQDVAQLLRDSINDWLSSGAFPPCLELTSALSSDRRQWVVDQFRESNARVLIASTLAAGEGLNLQFCSDAIMLERQWNPANEEQAEDRFHRFGQQNNVSITYFLASGTIDEYFTEIVERKRAIVSAALDGREIQWDQQSLMKELSEMLISRGREKWKL
jgi:SWI/SNF-related matrix-associated actin-dependent regulator 1 of chromatin subfamily A